MAVAVVTGSSGFIGRILVRQLLEDGHRVVRVDRQVGDVSEPATWAGLPRADHVFHLAGRSFVPDAWAAPHSFIVANVASTTQALEYCRRSGAHMVFASAYVYGIPARLPIDEEHPVVPNNPYALSKVLAEQTCRFYAETFGTAVTIVRPFNVFGPGQRREFLIPTIVDQVRTGVDIRLEDLRPRRDYVFVDDLASAMVLAISAPKRYRVFNVGSGISYSVAEIVETVQAAAGTKLSVVARDLARPNEIRDIRADISRARDELGWTPSRTFAEGIAAMLKIESAKS